MSIPRFDTLKYSNKLKEVGFTSEQAEALCTLQDEIFTVNIEQLVTKSDLLLANNDLKTYLNELQNTISTLEQRLIIRLGGIIIIVVTLLGLVLKF